MKLKQLKMSGFKSFVEPTKIPFKSNITGVVGPNGCGKSNVIDAVKWVLGENSAKNLRSDLIANVIFSGSTSRKPAGQASVELLFDNSSGRLTGEYHAYSEISVKRVMNADGNSTYYLNSTRCRRKDVTDVFLGTGLGPRSYSIIEQGIISKFVEAKPEDLRVYVEEAAGISKYKERRRETNNKIKSTQENLIRISDLKEELSRQLEKIKKQSNTAERYKSLKIEEEELRLQLLALKWSSTNELSEITEKKLNINSLELESAKTTKESIETELVCHREQAQALQNEQFVIQEEHYKINSEIAKKEQSLKHYEERTVQILTDLESIQNEINNYNSEIAEDTKKMELLSSDIEEVQDGDNPVEYDFEGVKSLHQSMERQKLSMEEKLASTVEKIVHFEKVISLEEERLNQFSSQRQLIEGQRKNLLKDLEEIDLQELAKDKNILVTQFKEVEDLFNKSKQELMEVQQLLEKSEIKQSELLEQEKREFHKLQDLKIILATLEAEQRNNDSNTLENAENWLQRRGYDGNPLLRETIEVTPGWELALEVVLGDKLQAVCLDKMIDSFQHLNELQGNITLLSVACKDTQNYKSNLTLLLTKIINPSDVAINLLEGVYVVDSLSQAHSILPTLSKDESLVTKEGVWLHKSWIRVSRPADIKDSVIAKQKKIDKSKEQIQELQKVIGALSETKAQFVNTIKEEKSRFDKCRHEKDSIYQRRVAVESKLQYTISQLESFTKKQTEIRSSLQNIESQLGDLSNDSSIASENLQQAKEELEPMLDTKLAIQNEKNQFDEKFILIRKQSEEAIELQYQNNLKEQTLITELKGLERNIVRLKALFDKAKEKELAIKTELDSKNIMSTLREELELNLNQQIATEEELHQVQQRISDINEIVISTEAKRTETEQLISRVNNTFQQLCVELERYRVKCSSIAEQTTEMDIEILKLKDYLPENGTEEEIADSLQIIVKKIERLGVINLTAIDEYNTEKERYEYYKQQSTDLEEALNVLIVAIRKIDSETKNRFKSTYTVINDNFKELFPKLFGGGKAELYLTDKNLLDAGVGIIAKPPGKKITNISALSGGEKAMTAVALVLAIFKLNPSPFCMLDEVDAPLDDANVLRFCEVIKEMSKSVQFIIITHNKLTMEMTEQLSGVTMQEPGVSRLVSVDIEEIIDAA